MKKVFLAILLVVGLTATAQQEKMMTASKAKMASEQKAELYVKKMTLELDLNEKQATEIRKIATVQVQKREAQKEEFKEQRVTAQADRSAIRVEMKNKMLEDQIALKAEMKKILTPEQYTKWEINQSEKQGKMKDRMGKRMSDRK